MRLPEHLTHLRRDRAGRPVPYINVWGHDNEPERMRKRYDRAIGAPGAFYLDCYDDPPNFTKQSPQRQRECMVLGKCQVCARPVEWPDRHLVISSVSVQSITVSGLQAAVIHEPWLCPDCADFATRVCPALIRRGRDEDLTLLPVTAPEQVRLVHSLGWIEGPHEAVTRAEHIAIKVKLYLLHVQVKHRGR